MVSAEEKTVVSSSPSLLTAGSKVVRKPNQDRNKETHSASHDEMGFSNRSNESECSMYHSEPRSRCVSSDIPYQHSPTTSHRRLKSDGVRGLESANTRISRSNSELNSSGWRLTPQDPKQPVACRSEAASPILASTTSAGVNRWDGFADHEVSTGASHVENLVCPICADQMVTLRQLNRHIDDTHLLELRKSPTRLGGVQWWLQKAFASQSSGNVPLESDERVTRKHWQEQFSVDNCSISGCRNTFSKIQGPINCAHCGKVFCSYHAQYSVKLSTTAKYDPSSGYWCRVCENCYINRPGYGDHGAARDMSQKFQEIRKRKIEQRNFDALRLKTKLEKLLRARCVAQKKNRGPLTARDLRAIDQSVTLWRCDTDVNECPLCGSAFSFLNRKHHCRLCGSVICSESQTQCSETVLFYASVDDQQQIMVNILLCRNCNRKLSVKVAPESTSEPPFVRSYRTLMRFKDSLCRLRVRVLEYSQTLRRRPPDIGKLDWRAIIDDATEARRKYLEAVTRFDQTSKKIGMHAKTIAQQQQADYPVGGQSDIIICQSVLAWAQSFLREHLYPLQMLTKGLERAKQFVRETVNSDSEPSLDTISSKKTDKSSSVAEVTSGGSGNNVELELHERLIVLQEQQYFVNEMIADAERRRKFDEIDSLQESLIPLQEEIGSIERQLEDLNL